MSRLTGIAACFLAILAVAQANAETATSPSANDGTSATDGAYALFTEDDLLLFDTTAGGLELTDSLPGYSSRAGIFLPLGQLSRLLDLSIIIDPPAHRAEVLRWCCGPDAADPGPIPCG